MFNATKQKAREIALQVSAELPASLQNKKSRKGVDLSARAQLQFRKRIAAYQEAERMWFVRRIVFSKALQRELLQLGYEGDIVRDLMSEALSALSFGQ